ncbi:MAG TPA: hypothetical protein VIT43_08200, partial [Candidatus Dormibacteraeota bacterium]
RPTPAPSFAITFAGELVWKTNSSGNGNGSNRCSQLTVHASGAFTTNGAGGVVSYEWVRVDNTGNRIVISEAPIRIAAGDRSWHSVVSDSFTPAHSGSEQLVFLSPTYPVAAQSWSCLG